MRIRRRLLTDVYEEIKGSSVKGCIYEENKSAFLKSFSALSTKKYVPAVMFDWIEDVSPLFTQSID